MQLPVIPFQLVSGSSMVMSSLVLTLILPRFWIHYVSLFMTIMGLAVRVIEFKDRFGYNQNGFGTWVDNLLNLHQIFVA